MERKLPDRLHVLARRTSDQWVLACLDFTLAAQDDTFQGARQRLLDQIESYVEEALTWDEGAHADELLSRKAPLSEWMLFYAASLLSRFHAASNLLRGFQQPFPLEHAQA